MLRFGIVGGGQGYGEWPKNMVAGTVITRASVESSSMEPISDSDVLYFEANRTMIVAIGKLQQIKDPSANGLRIDHQRIRPKKQSIWIVIRATAPATTNRER